MTAQYGERPDVPNVAVVITDGCTNIDPDRTVPNALAAKAGGNHMISIGIGGNTNEVELRAMASDPQSENVLFADSWTDLPGIVDGLVAATCNGDDLCYKVLTIEHKQTNKLLILFISLSVSPQMSMNALVTLVRMAPLAWIC